MKAFRADGQGAGLSVERPSSLQPADTVVSFQDIGRTLNKGAFNRSAVGTLEERTLRLVLWVWVWVKNAPGLASLEGCSRVLNGIPEPMSLEAQQPTA